MPKGTDGCFTCGAATEVALQVWHREYLEGDFDAGGNRRQRTIKSIVRHYCGPCGELALELACAAIERRVRPYLGCAHCATRATGRIQVWLRTLEGKSMRSKAGSFCDDCRTRAFALAAADLDPSTYADGHPPTSDNLAHARARLTA